MAALFALTSAPDGGGNSNAGNNQGYTPSTSPVPVVPNALDIGHIFDGALYFGTLTGWTGRTGVITPDASKGDAPLPVLRVGETPTCRASIEDFLFPPSNGTRVQFYVLRDSIGDKLAKNIGAL